MAIQLNVTRAPETRLKRLKGLARVGLTLDFMGYRIEYKYAPVLETLLNVRAQKKGLAEIAKAQFAEMATPSAPSRTKKPTRKKVSSRTSKKTKKSSRG